MNFEHPLERLAGELNKFLTPKATARFTGEELVIEAAGKTLWLDSDFLVVGESSTPESGGRSDRHRPNLCHRPRHQSHQCNQGLRDMPRFPGHRQR